MACRRADTRWHAAPAPRTGFLTGARIMKVLAIADLHLSGAVDKPMDVFGPLWEDHRRKIEQNWTQTVSDDDVVLVCGDLSWASTLAQAEPDLKFIDSLPGTKFFIRGNHDYWFDSPSKVRAAVGPSMKLVRFDAHVVRGVGICGIRAWPWPGLDEYEEEHDRKHWDRAKIRLGLSLDSLAELDWNVAVAMFHYPPLTPSQTSELCEMIRDAGISQCVYGHLHGEALRHAFEGDRDGVYYRCVSADHVDFRPVPILDR